MPFRPASLFALCLSALSAAPDTVDPSFASSAGQIFDPSQYGGVASSIVQPDGKVIFGSNEMGGTVDGTPLQLPLIRINPDGTVDSTFGADNAPNGGGLGIVTFSPGFSEVHCLALQSDGKIIAAGDMQGYSADGASITHGGQSIVRFNPDGTPDETFATRGTLQSGGFNYINDVEVQGDGKILAAGGFGGVRNADSSFFQRKGLVRFLPDGSVDPDFVLNSNEYEGVPSFASGFVRDVEVDEGGRIYAAVSFFSGITEYFNKVCRLRPDGSRDFSFAPAFSGSFIQAIDLDHNGRILIIGRDELGSTSYMERFLPDGSRDPSFTLDPSLGLVSGEQLEESPTGQYYLTTDGGSRAVRINQDGSLDPAFNPTSDYPDSPAGPSNGFFRCFTLSPDGSVYAGSSFSSVDGTSTKKIVKFEGDATPGSSVINFTRTAVTTTEGERTLVLSAVRTGDLSAPASVLVTINGGSADGSDFTAAGPYLLEWPAGLGGAQTFSIGLLDDAVEDGTKTIGLSLGNPGGATLGPDLSIAITIIDDESPATITTPPANTAVVSGQNATFSVGFTSATATTFQWRLNGDLIPGANGISVTLTALTPGLDGATITVEITNASSTITSPAATLTVSTPDGARDFSFPGDLGNLPLVQGLTALSDGSFLVKAGTGGFNSPLKLARLLSDGSLEESFGPEFLNTTSTTVIDSVVTAPNGKIYVSGTFNLVGGIARNGLVRLTADGIVDTFFNPPARPTSGLFVDLQGRVYFSFGRDLGLVRLLDDGTIDSGFNPGIGQDFLGGTIYAMTGDFLGRLYVADFVSNQPQGFPARLQRLLPSGKIDPSFAAPPLPSLRTMTVLSDGRLAIGFNNGLMILNEDGFPDLDFVVPDGVLSTVSGIIEDRGALLVTGGASLVRLLKSGQVDPTFPPAGGGAITTALRLSPESLLLAPAGNSFNGGEVPTLFSIFARQPSVDFTKGGIIVAENAGSFEVMVQATGDLSSPVTATLSSIDGTAGASSQFNPVSEVLIFDEDHPARTVTVDLIDDAAANDTRQFTLALVIPELGSEAMFQVTLIDDESGPVITGQPQDLVVAPGTTGLLQVTLADATGATFQWFRNGQALNNATNFSYQPGSAGTYHAEVTRGGATIRSDSAIVTFEPDGSAIVNGFAFASPLVSNPVKVIQSDAQGAAFVGAQGQLNGTGTLSRILPDNSADPAWTPLIRGTIFDLAVDAVGGVVIAGDLDIRDAPTVVAQLARYSPGGTRDLDFQSNLGSGPGASGSIRVVSRYPNGDLLVGGNFNEWNGTPLGTASSLVKLDAAGNRIASFESNVFGEVASAVALPDGGAVAIYRNTVHRLDDTGTSIANRFLNNGLKKITVTGDGKFLVTSSQNFSSGGNNGSVARLDANLNIERVFPINRAEIALAQANGKVVVGGTFISNGRRKIARFLPDGSIDPSFSTANGLRTFSENDGNLVTSLAETPEGQIWVGGTFPGFGPANRVNFPNLALINGDAITIEFLSQPSGGLIPTAEPITLTAEVSSDLALTYQWERDGTPMVDSDTVGGSQSDTLTLLPPVLSGDYRLVVTGGPATAASDAAFVGVLASPAIRRISEGLTTASDLPVFLQVEAYGAGTLSYQWSKNGVPLPGETSPLLAFPSAQTSNGGSYTVTITNDLGSLTSDPIEVTVLQNGAAVADGYQSPQVSGDVFDLLVLPGNRVLIGGGFFSFRSADFSVNGGQYLATMGTDGSVGPDLGLGINSTVQVLARQADGKILIGGLFAEVGGQARKKIARLTAELALDESFDAGELFTDFANIEDIAVDAEGRILVAHSNSNLDYLVRLLPNGELDTSFTVSPSSLIDRVIPQADGTYLVSGNFNNWGGGPTASKLVVIDEGGALVTSPDFDTENRRLNLLLPLSDGNLLAGYNTGALDLFGPTGAALASSFDQLGLDSIVDDALESSGGNVYLGGAFTTAGGESHNRLVRTDLSGLRDASFDPGTGFNDRVYALAEAENGNLWVGGRFSQYNGTTANRIILLKGEETPPALPDFESFIAGTDLTGEEALFTADPDRDTLTNGLEFLLGGDPENPDPDLVPVPVVRKAAALGLDGESAYLTLEIVIPEELVGLPWSVEASDDLTFSGPGLVPAIMVGDPVVSEGRATYLFRAPWPVSDPRGRGFLRLTTSLTVN